MTRSHPRNVFIVDWAPYPCPSFLWEMGSLRSVSASLLGKKTRLIWWKRCHSIWHLSLGPPWMTEMKPSR